MFIINTFTTSLFSISSYFGLNESSWILNHNLVQLISSSDLLRPPTVIYVVIVIKSYLISKVIYFSMYSKRPNHSFTHHHSTFFINISYLRLDFYFVYIWTQLWCKAASHWLSFRASWLVGRSYVRTYTKWLPNIFYNHLIWSKTFQT